MRFFKTKASRILRILVTPVKITLFGILMEVLILFTSYVAEEKSPLSNQELGKENGRTEDTGEEKDDDDDEEEEEEDTTEEEEEKGSQGSQRVQGQKR